MEEEVNTQTQQEAKVTPLDEAIYNVAKVKGLFVSGANDFNPAVDVATNVITAVKVMFPDSDPVYMTNKIYGEPMYPPKSENVPKDEKVQTEYVYNQVKKSQLKIQKDIDNLIDSAKNIVQLPEKVQGYIQDSIQKGKSFTDVVRDLQETVGAVIDGKLGTQTVKAIKSKYKSRAVNQLLKEFGVTEGTGDKVTNVSTGELGMTTVRKNILEEQAGKQLTDKEAAEMYLGQLYDKIDSLSPDMPEEYKTALVDTLYNTGAGIIKNTSTFKELIQNPNEENFQKTVLPLIYVDGLSSKGTARRRAEAYNKINPSKPIKYIEQKSNGDINYYDENEQLIYSVNSRTPKHASSRAGWIDVSSGKSYRPKKTK